MTHISKDEARRLKLIGALRSGRDSIKAIIADLRKFVKTDLKESMTNPALQTRLGITAFKKSEDLYQAYTKFNISESSMRRAMSSSGVTRQDTYYHLREIVDLYLAQYDHLLPKAEETDRASGAVFSRETAYTLMERAHRFCSVPYCRRATSAPSLQDPVGVYRLGFACPIYGAEPGDPRYDPKVPYRHDDIENGIWLCSLHAEMINADKAGDFTACQLKEWKRLHETLIHAVATGEKRMFFEMRKEEADRAPAAKLLGFFNGLHELYSGPGAMPKENIILLVKDIGAFLLELDSYVFHASMLAQQIDTIHLTCEAFGKVIMPIDDGSTFYDGFSILRKIIGGLLAETAAFYELEIPDRVRGIMPEDNNQPII